MKAQSSMQIIHIPLKNNLNGITRNTARQYAQLFDTYTLTPNGLKQKTASWKPC
jgi:hypothetical protein